MNKDDFHLILFISLKLNKTFKSIVFFIFLFIEINNQFLTCINKIKV